MSDDVIPLVTMKNICLNLPTSPTVNQKGEKFEHGVPPRCTLSLTSGLLSRFPSDCGGLYQGKINKSSPPKQFVQEICVGVNA